MKSILGIIVGFALAATALFFYIYSPAVILGFATEVETALEGALVISSNLEDGNTKTELYYENGVSVDELFLNIEAISTYMVDANFSYNDKNYKVELSSTILDEQIKAIENAESLAKHVATDDMEIYDKLEAIHDYIVLNTAYDVQNVDNLLPDDPSLSVVGVMDNKTAVCAGYARTFMAMARAVNIDTIYVSDVEMNHGWNALSYYGDIYYIDTTYDDPVPDKPGRALREYFMISQEELLKTHKFDEMFFDKIIREYFDENLEYIQRLVDMDLLYSHIDNTNAKQPVSFETIEYSINQAGFDLEIEEKENYTEKEIYALFEELSDSEHVVTNGMFAKLLYEKVK